jgi:1-deoxy-D-xylulose-5-phosphate reductoisomerase
MRIAFRLGAQVKKVFILGSTGSIGVNALSVCHTLQKDFRVVGISGHSNLDLLTRQADKFRPRFVIVTDRGGVHRAPQKLLRSHRVLSGDEGLKEALLRGAPDIVVNAIWGTSGVAASLLAVEYCRTLALANKESMVVAGKILLSRAKQRGCLIIPVDSEHSAIFQALLAGRREELKRVILTASGGPLRGLKKGELSFVSPAQALKHPVWSMGKRITLDSATMMNKALEMIEARYLFDLRPEQIEVVIHPEGIVHSIVEFCDSSMIAQMSVPDMRVAIQYAITYPHRQPNSVAPVDLVRLKRLTFLSASERRFPALSVGRLALKMGGTSGAVVASANEVAGAAFLEGKIRFPRVVEIVLRVLQSHKVSRNPHMEAVREAQTWAQERAALLVSRSATSLSRKRGY